ncbi:MAG: DUF1552 domain-containing protein [Planctomycetota bacterium]
MSSHPLRTVLSRRTVLRGLGVSIAVPWLESMLPSLRSPAPTPARAVFVFAPNGMKMDDWLPQQRSLDAALPPLLEPFAPLRKRLSVVLDAEIDAGRGREDGPGDHARAAATFLTCARAKKTGGKDIHCGISVDQVLAREIGGASLLPSLELGLERGAAAGVCDSGYSCAYSNHISWRTPTRPVAKETDPRAAFTRLFGDPDAAADAAAAARERARKRSILDLALADAKDLNRKLPAADRVRLAEYLDAVRQLELRIQRLDEENAGDAARRVDGDFLEQARGQGIEGQLSAMYEIIALALQTERTRVVSFMLGNAGSDRSYPHLGIADGHHTISHHGNDPVKLAAIGKINRFHAEQCARFLGRLAAMSEGDGDVLRNSVVLYGSGISDGNSHAHSELPILLAGNASGRIRSRGVVAQREKTPLANLHRTILWAILGKDTPFADSTGVVEAVTA